jgi:hypothetical protein
MPTIEIPSYESFFAWCREKCLVTDRQIAEAFGRTPQTVRNWKRARKDGLGVAPPRHLSLACSGFEALQERPGEIERIVNDGAEYWFQNWRSRHGLGTLESTGSAFGLTRQAIHNWDKRERLPRWLPLTCLGYERVASDKGSKKT